MDDQFIREQLREVGGNVSKLSRLLGLDYVEMKARYGEDETPVRKTQTRPGDIRDLGRSWLKHRVIAVKPVCGEWPDEFADVIYSARKKVDRGTHTMCQNVHESGWVVLYLIPLQRPLKTPKPWFFPEPALGVL